MSTVLRILLLTHGTPFPVRSGGQMYTANVIQTLAARDDIELTVIATGSEDSLAHSPSGPSWHLFQPPRGAGILRGLFGRYPRSVAATMSRGYRNRIRSLLSESPWDVVIVDYIAIGWAIGDIRRLVSPQDTEIVYLSHNVESTLRMRIADGYSGIPQKWVAVRDARKAAHLEAEIVRSATLVTAETEEDAAEFRLLFDAQRIHLYTPGYDGHINEARPRPLQDTQRAVAVIGSRNATMKRLVLDELLQSVASGLEKRGIKIIVAGDAPGDYLAARATEYPHVEFQGYVEDIVPLLASVRLGLITDQIGGGFKHRVLTLVFNRVPIIATRDAMAGLPLKPNVHYLEVSGNDEAVDRVGKVIDDVHLLDRIQDAAFAACKSEFDWAASTDAFVTALNATRVER